MEILFPGSANANRRFTTEFVELSNGTRTAIGALSVIPFPVEHFSGAPSYALRIECESKVVAYSGDTEWTETLIDAARGADLFVCEAYFFEKKIKHHLDYRTLRDNLRRLECKRLIVTHMSPDMLARVAEIEVDVAHDGMQLAL